jgi:hypothetical protein
MNEPLLVPPLVARFQASFRELRRAIKQLIIERRKVFSPPCANAHLYVDLVVFVVTPNLIFHGKPSFCP